MDERASSHHLQVSYTAAIHKKEEEEVSDEFFCSIRVGNELGAGNPKVARLSVIVVVTASIAFSVLVTLLVVVLRYPLSTLYTSSATIIDAVISLMPLLAISIFLNGIQPILSGIYSLDAIIVP
jgi:hypothetical protein